MSKCSKRTNKNNLQCRELGDEARLFKIIRWTWSGFLSFCVKQVPFFGRDSNPPDCLPRLWDCMSSPTVARCLTSWFEAWKRAFLNAIRRFTGEGHWLWFALQPQYGASKVSSRSTKRIQNPAIRNPSKFACQQGLYSHVTCFCFAWNLWRHEQRVGLVFIVDLKSWRGLNQYISMRSMS